MRIIGKVFIIGAGCAEYDLITLRGMRALKQCDTVVFDSLTDMRLLDFILKGAEKIYVGKRAGSHTIPQEEINKILVYKALEGKTVARLKGGDPFVFGRGGEEIIALRENNIPYTVIPGISSSIAVAELFGIPVTHRNISRSFHVITGHTSNDLMPKNLEKYAKLNGTLVILMGLRNLEKIVDGLLAGGMCKDTPAAVISNCGYETQQIVRESLDCIANAAKNAGLKTPAIIVIGETVRYDFSPTYHAPLEGITVTVTGTEKIQNKLASKLECLGARVYKSVRLNIKECEDAAAFDNALRNISSYGFLVLTSPNGAEVFLKRYRELKIDIRNIGSIKIAVIGTGTAKVLESAGIYPDLIPEKFTSKALGETVAKNVSKEKRVLILRSSEGSKELLMPLDEKGKSYDDISSYCPVYAEKAEHPITAETDYIVFTSAGGIKNYFYAGNEISECTKIICIGEVAGNRLKEYKNADFKIPAESSVEGIIDLILEDTANESIQKAESQPSDAQNGA